MDAYTSYYLNQIGKGEIGQVYRASYGYQRGRGIGSVLGGLFRFVKPLFIKGVKALGREALNTGANILSDIATRKPEQKVGDIVTSRVKETGEKIRDRIMNMTGSGLRPSPINKKRKIICSQSRLFRVPVKKRKKSGSKSNSSTRNKKKKTLLLPRDIFSSR